MWQQLFDLVNGEGWCSLEDIFKPGKGIDTMQLAGAEQAVEHCSSLSSFMRAAEQIVFPANCYRSYAVFNGVVVNVEHSVGCIEA